MPGKSPFLFLFPFSLSLYLILLSLPSLLSLLFSFLSSLIHPYFLILFVPSLSLFISFHFLFLSIFSFLIFSSLPFSLFSSFYLLLPVWIKWGKLPPSFLLGRPLVITMFFFLIFFIFFFPFITSCNTWLNLSHLFQMHHMTHAIFHFLSVPCGITWSCHVSLDTGCLEKCEILPISESDEIRWGI